MNKKPMFWVEVTCDGSECDGYDAGYCHHVREGAFVRDGHGLRRQATEAVKEGWRVEEDGRSLCPGCVASLTKQNNKN